MKNLFLVPYNSLVCIQQNEAEFEPWDWIWPTLTQGLNEVLHRQLSLSSEGPVLALGPLLTWCALEQVLFTPCKQPAIQLDTSLWADQQTKDLRSEAKEERKGHDILIMSPKEKNGNRVLQAPAAQSWIWGFQRFPAVMWMQGIFMMVCKEWIQAHHQHYPWRGLTEIDMILGRSLPIRSWMQVDQAITVIE